LFALDSLGTLDALGAGGTRCSGLALDALKSLFTLCALGAGCTGRTSFALGTLRANIAWITFVTLVAFGSIGLIAADRELGTANSTFFVSGTQTYGCPSPAAAGARSVKLFGFGVDVPVAGGALVIWGTFAGKQGVEIFDATGQFHQRGDLRQR